MSNSCQQNPTNRCQSYNPTRNILLIPGESSNNGNASGPVTILLRHGVTMQPSSSPLRSLSRLSTLILCTLIFSTIFSTSAFAQGSGKRLVPAEGNDRDQPQKRAEWNRRGREAPKGESAAALRLRAHQQKMAMRAQREAAARAAGAGLASSPQVT